MRFLHAAPLRHAIAASRRHIFATVTDDIAYHYTFIDMPPAADYYAITASFLIFAIA